MLTAVVATYGSQVPVSTTRSFRWAIVNEDGTTSTAEFGGTHTSRIAVIPPYAMSPGRQYAIQVTATIGGFGQSRAFTATLSLLVN